jgi:hypothetical protein
VICATPHEVFRELIGFDAIILFRVFLYKLNLPKQEKSFVIILQRKGEVLEAIIPSR